MHLCVMSGVDTRALTKIIRERGSMLGRIEVVGGGGGGEFWDPNKVNLTDIVSCKVSTGNGTRVKPLYEDTSEIWTPL